MIVVKISGGLGNQLFQYAIGRQLSLIHKTELKLDTSDYENYELHNYGLNKFNIKAVELTSEEIESYLDDMFRFRVRLRRKILKYMGAYGLPYVFEKETYKYDSKVLLLPNDVFLNGHWQTDKYFRNIRDELLAELSFPESKMIRDSPIGNKISSTNSVSIHIRRGDYASESVNLEKYGLCSMEYYVSCVNEINNLIESPHFFIFSDDPAWVMKKFKINYDSTVIEFNDNAHNDLYLMSLCKHNIIANSTFSWWGAWLNSNNDKIVFAPKKWLAGPRNNVSDLIPNGWYKR